MNILLINTDTYSKNSKEQNCIRKAQKALRDSLNEEIHGTDTRHKNDTCIAFRLDIKKH